MASTSAELSTGKGKMKYTMTPLAYTLPLLHAARYLSHTVIGLFLGSIDGDDVQIVDVLPLIHHYKSLSPMMEIGLELGSASAQERNLRVVGLYIISEDGQSELGRVGERVLAGLREKFEGAFAMTVNNTRLSKGLAPYIIYCSTSTTSTSSTSTTSALPTPDDNSLPAPFSLPSTPDLPAKTLNFVREQKAHRGLNDFDDHLEDSTKDWLSNAEVKDAVNKYFQ